MRTTWVENGKEKTAEAVDPDRFGPHEYPYEDGTSDCKFGCGCWAGPSRSGGPVDPFGLCPNHPITIKERLAKLKKELADLGKCHEAKLAELHAQAAKIRSLDEQLDVAENEARRLRTANMAHAAKAGADYWAWMGDGSDHLESLSCPVLINAGNLRELLRKAGEENRP